MKKFSFLIFVAFFSVVAYGQLFTPLGLGVEKCIRNGSLYIPQMHVEGDILYVCTNQGLYSKDLSNEGSEWQLVGFEGIPLQDYVRKEDDILALRYSYGYNENQGFFLLSHDGGKTYEDVTPDLFTGQHTGWTNALTSLVRHPEDPNTLLVSCLPMGLFQSSDFGQTWNQLTDITSDHIGYHPLNPQIIYICGEDDAFSPYLDISYDGGQTWEDYSPYYPGDNCISHIAFHPTDPDKWVAAGCGAVYTSADNGHTWNTQDYVGDVQRNVLWYSIAYDNGNSDILYTAGCAKDKIEVMYSMDGGMTWSVPQTEPMKKSSSENVNDFQQYREKLLVYTESDVYEISKAELLAQTASPATVTINGVNFFLYLDSHEAVLTNGRNCSGELDIPSEVSYNDETFTVKSMTYNAFLYSSELTKVKIPKSIESIRHSYPYDPDDEDAPTGMVSPDHMNPFYGCSALESIEVDEENPSMKSVDGVLFSKDGTRLYCYPIGKQQEVYTIPDAVEWIGASAFEGSQNLTTLTIPSGVTYIGECAFADCNNFTDVYCYAENVPSTGSAVFGDTPTFFDYQLPIASATLHVPAGSVDKYKTTYPWSDFGNIVALQEEPHQPQSFLEGNPIWVYKYERLTRGTAWKDGVYYGIFVDTGYRDYRYYFLGGQEEIDGKVYTMMGEVKSNGEGELAVSRWLPVREENGIVYAFTDSLPGLVEHDYLEPPYLQQGNECVLYNFNTEIGESLYPQNEYTKVESYGTYQLMNGAVCRVLKTTIEDFDLYEKLGYLHDGLYYGVMDPPSELISSTGGDVYATHLNAYYQNDIMLYKAPDIQESICVNDTCWSRDDGNAYVRSYKVDPRQEEVFAYIRQLQKEKEPVSFTAGQMATIILPTAPDASKGKYYRLDRYEDGQIIFEQELQPQAHIPYIIVPNEDFSIDLSALDLAGCYRDTVSVDGISFIGSYVSETFDYPDGFYIDFIDITHDCRFDEYCVIGALRAYLLVRWDDPYNQGGTRVPPLNKRGIVLRDYETGITSPLGETGEATLYDLQGRMLPSKPAQGIYIENRQKVMVK